MKYLFAFLLFFSVPTFTMEYFLKRITLPSTEKLTEKLDNQYHSLAHKLGGKTLYPTEVLMIIHGFYNYEDNLSKKSEHFKKDIPTLIDTILSDHPDVIVSLKKHVFKI